MLIVEDDLASANALRILLSYRGYEVAQVGTLGEAFAMLDQTYGAVILDLMLPDGDGAKLLEHIRRLALPIKVLVTTGVNDAARVQDVNRFNPELFLKKPINLAELLRKLSPESNGTVH